MLVAPVEHEQGESLSRVTYNFPRLSCSTPWVELEAMGGNFFLLGRGIFLPFIKHIEVYRVLKDQFSSKSFLCCLQLEEESSKLFQKILKDHKIVLKTNDKNSIRAIDRWILSFSCTLWKGVFCDFFRKGATYSKGSEFLAHYDSEKAVKCAVLRYF